MARKSKKVTLNRKSSKSIEERHVGREITDWSDVKNMENSVYETLRHYGYFYDYKTSAKWAKSWIKKNRNKDLKNFSAAEDWYISRTLGSLCKMMLNGASFDLERMTWIDGQIKDVIARGKDNIKNRNAESIPSKRSPAEIVKERTSDFIGEVEGFLDDYTLGRMTKDEVKEWSLYDLMRVQELPYNSAKAVHDYYIPLHQELTELVKEKPKDLIEAYADMPARARTAYLKLIERILEESNLYMDSKKAIKKPRVKKVQPKDKQVSGLRYKPEDKSLKIASMDSTKIIGATEIYLYDVSYRKLKYIKTDQPGGFTVRGSTIFGIDMEASFTKTLRKPEEFFGKSAKTTKGRLKKLVDELKTKPQGVNGRTNENTIIFKVY